MGNPVSQGGENPHLHICPGSLPPFPTHWASEEGSHHLPSFARILLAELIQNPPPRGFFPVICRSRNLPPWTYVPTPSCEPACALRSPYPTATAPRVMSCFVTLMTARLCFLQQPLGVVGLFHIFEPSFCSHPLEEDVLADPRAHPQCLTLCASTWMASHCHHGRRGGKLSHSHSPAEPETQDAFRLPEGGGVWSPHCQADASSLLSQPLPSRDMNFPERTWASGALI